MAVNDFNISTICEMLLLVKEFIENIPIISAPNTIKEPTVNIRFVCLDFEDTLPSSNEITAPITTGTKLTIISKSIANT